MVTPVTQSEIYATTVNLGCVSLRKSKIGFLNPKESENGFCASFIKRLIQDHSDHGASKDVKGTDESIFIVDSSVPLMHHDPRDIGLIWLVKKRKIRFWIFSNLRIQSWIFLKKRTVRMVVLIIDINAASSGKLLFTPANN